MQGFFVTHFSIAGITQQATTRRSGCFGHHPPVHPCSNARRSPFGPLPRQPHHDAHPTTQTTGHPPRAPAPLEATQHDPLEHVFATTSTATLAATPTKVPRQREEEEAERAEEVAMKAAQELDQQIQADAMRQMLAEEQQYKSRKRAISERTETTEVPTTLYYDTIKKSFQDIDINGVRLDIMRLFHPRPGTFPHDSQAQMVTTFDSPSRIDVYGRASSGRHQSCQPSRALHREFLSVYARKLVFPPNAMPILMVLMEQAPPLTLHDVLEDSESIREDIASVRVSRSLL